MFEIAMNSDLTFETVKLRWLAEKTACKTAESGEINIRRRYVGAKNALASSKCYFCCIFLIKSANEI